MKSYAVALLIACSAACQAAQDVKVCALPENGRKPYLVDAQEMFGSELNQRTGRSGYLGYAHYVVIFWKDHEASIIQLEVPNVLSVHPTPGTDQNGRPWTVTLSGGICY